MTGFTIFCANGHLVLDRNCCPECGWQRPRPAQSGCPAWGPSGLGGELGAPGRGRLPKPVVSGSAVVFALSGGSELAGIDLADGHLLWRAGLEPGRRVSGLADARDHALVSVCDDRTGERLEASENGWLAAVDPVSGTMERLWTASRHRVGPPAFEDGVVAVVTGTPELEIFDLTPDGLVERWRRPLQTSMASGAPLIAGGLVIVSDGLTMSSFSSSLWLAAFDLTSGAERWRAPVARLLSETPRAAGGVIVYREAEKTIAARAVKDGELVWQRQAGRVYAAPDILGESVLAVVRGSTEHSAPDHYRLQSFALADGSEGWRAGLPARGRQVLCAASGAVLAAMENGHVASFDGADGRLLWEQSFGDAADPLRSDIALAGGLVLAATQSGQVSAVWVDPPPERPGDPGEYLAAGQLAEAADAYALAGDLLRAAEVYHSGLRQPQPACLLFEQAGQYQRAAELALENGWLGQALRCYELDGDLAGQARVLLLKGDEAAAAERYEKAGDLPAAARYFEQAGNYARALDLYEQIGDEAASRRLRNSLPADLKTILLLEELNRPLTAAEKAMQGGYYDHAVRLYRELEQPERELEALRRLTASGLGETWSLERLAGLACAAGLYEEEAAAWARLSESLRAAEAWQRAAESAAQTFSDQAKQRGVRQSALDDARGRAAELFRKAWEAFRAAKKPVQAELCWKRRAFFGKIPQVVVEGRASHVFKEGGSSYLDLTITNRGFGIVEGVRFSVNEERFALDHASSGEFTEILEPDDARGFRLYLSALPGQHGSLPLVLEWAWSDARGAEYQGRSVTPVQVKARGESTGAQQPAVIHYHGTVIQNDGGQMEVISGDKVQHKGDRAIVVEGQAGAVSLETGCGEIAAGDTGEIEPHCQDCGKPVPAGDAFCMHCGSPVRRKM